jgi:tRNA(Ile)-lysidine synthase
MPALEAALGPGIADALARSASQLRDDAEALDGLAASQAELVRDGDGGWRAAELAALPAAIRTRVLRRAAIEGGCPPGALTARHIGALDSLLTGWHGQLWTDLPGGIRGTRHCGKLLFAAAAAPLAPRGVPGHPGSGGVPREMLCSPGPAPYGPAGAGRVEDPVGRE